MKTTQKIVAGQSLEPSWWSVVALAQALGLSLEALAGSTPHLITAGHVSGNISPSSWEWPS